jgi:hypothetical protein
LVKNNSVDDEKIKNNEDKPVILKDDRTQDYGINMKIDNGSKENLSDYNIFSEEETITEDAVDTAEKFQDVITDSNYDEFYDANDYSTTIVEKENNHDEEPSEYPDSNLAEEDSNFAHKEVDEHQVNYFSEKQSRIIEQLIDEHKSVSFSEEKKYIFDKLFKGQQTTYQPQDTNNFVTLTSFEENFNFKTKIEDHYSINLTENFHMTSNNFSQETPVNTATVITCYFFGCCIIIAFIVVIGYLCKTLKNRISSNKRIERYRLLLRHSK